MDSRHLILAALYFGPFILALVMPGWRSLIALSLAVAAFAVWALGLREGAGGIAGTVETVLYIIVLMGAGAGLVGRGILLALKSRGFASNWASSLIVTAAGVAPLIAVAAMGALDG